MKDIETHIIYCIVKQKNQENEDIIGKKCTQDNNGVLEFNKEDKKKAQKQHYERFLNVEFLWPEKDLSTADPALGPPLLSPRRWW